MLLDGSGIEGWGMFSMDSDDLFASLTASEAAELTKVVAEDEVDPEDFMRVIRIVNNQIRSAAEHGAMAIQMTIPNFVYDTLFDEILMAKAVKSHLMSKGFVVIRDKNKLNIDWSRQCQTRKNSRFERSQHPNKDLSETKKKTKPRKFTVRET